MTAPRGVIFYTSRITKAWDEAKARKEIAEYKAARSSMVILCVEAADGWRADHGVLVRVAEVIRNAGMEVGVYALPSREAWMQPEALADRLADAGIACGATLWCPDVEEQAKGLGPQVRRFRKRLMDRASERVSIMPTFYGKIPRVGGTGGDGFPWSAIVGWGSAGYQLYLTAEDDRAVDAKMADAFFWWGPDVVPHLGTYLGDAARLDGDIRRTCVAADGSALVLAIAFWQDSTTDDAERAVIAKWAAWLEDAARAQRADEPTQRLRPGA